jgi:tetratricopeptide (TPR) repeat protein
MTKAIITELKNLYKASQINRSVKNIFVDDVKKKLEDQLVDCTDIEALTYYALACYFIPIGDFYDSMTYLKKAISIKLDFYSVVLLAYIEDLWDGGISDETMNLLRKLDEKNRARRAVIYLLEAWYFKNSDNIRYQEHLELAVDCDPKMPQSLIELGLFHLKAERLDCAKQLIKSGLENISQIDFDTNSGPLNFDLDEFFDSFVRGKTNQETIYKHLVQSVQKPRLNGT